MRAISIVQLRLQAKYFHCNPFVIVVYCLQCKILAFYKISNVIKHISFSPFISIAFNTGLKHPSNEQKKIKHLLSCTKIEKEKQNMKLWKIVEKQLAPHYKFFFALHRKKNIREKKKIVIGTRVHKGLLRRITCSQWANRKSIRLVKKWFNNSSYGTKSAFSLVKKLWKEWNPYYGYLLSFSLVIIVKCQY